METGRYSSHNLSIEHFTAIQANTEVDPQRETIHRWLSAPDPSPNHIALVGEDIRLYVQERLQTDSKLERWREQPEVQREIADTLVDKADGM